MAVPSIMCLLQTSVADSTQRGHHNLVQHLMSKASPKNKKISLAYIKGIKFLAQHLDSRQILWVSPRHQLPVAAELQASGSISILAHLR